MDRDQFIELVRQRAAAARPHRLRTHRGTVRVGKVELADPPHFVRPPTP